MATSIKDANFSQTGEAAKEKVFQEPTAAQLIDDTKKNPIQYKDIPRPTGRVIFKLVNSKKNGRVYVDGTDDIYDPEKGTMRRARLITGVSTIWMDEQIAMKLDEEYAKKNRRSLRFEDRTCFLDAHDEAAIKFAKMSKHFIENPNRKSGSKHEFYEWNPAKQEAAALEKEMLEQEVMEIALSQPFEKVRKHAAYLGVSFIDELGEPRTEKGVRTLYVREARRRPDVFKKTLDSKDVEVSYLIKRAILDAKIDVGGRDGSITWATGGHICRLPKGRTPQEYLLELAMLPNEEGKTFLNQLQKQV